MSAPDSFDIELAAYEQAASRITRRIDATGHADPSPAAVQARAAAKLDGLRRFLREIGSPEQTLPIVHVTGTSGKGSTAAAIASLLQSAGLKTGLTTSPYLQVMTEKVQVDGRLLSGRALLAALEDVETAERPWLRAGNRPLAYGQLWTAVMLRALDQAGIDAAVIEVGAGGRFDLTNVVSPTACAITSIGLDHLGALGPTLADIAWHKAGIIKPGAPVVTGPLPPEGDAAVATAVDATGSAWVRLDRIPDSPMDCQLPAFVRANHRLAVAVTEAFANERGIPGERILADRIETVRLPGRMERMPSTDPAVILDGAHNPDKVRALATELHRRARLGSPPPVILFAALGAKDAASSLAALSEVACSFVMTESPVLGKRAMPAATLAGIARNAGAPNVVDAIPDVQRALDRALVLAAETKTDLLVTGSLYLLGAVRRRWYADDEIVCQQTPWPSLPDGA